MRSKLPKVLHPVCGVPMLTRVLNTVSNMKPASIGVVVGHEGNRVIAEVKKDRRIEWIWQKEPLGSGHAVRSASSWMKKSLKEAQHLLILCGDTPLISRKTLESFLNFHLQNRKCATILSSVATDPFGYGRIVRNGGKRVSKIVEEKDASPEERKINEINSGIYCFETKKLLEALPNLKNNNAKREYYITDAIEYLSQKNYLVETFPDALNEESFGVSETLGINTRADLASAEQFLQNKILKSWMKKGVTILNPGFTHIEESVQIEPETVLLPGTMLRGKTKIGSYCQIGPNSWIEDSEIGNHAVVRASFVYGSKIGERAQVGPYSHLRAGTRIAEGARVGNFTEIKNSKVGRETKISHLAYVGDSVLGEEINVGAGTITCNFDGKNKHKTIIGSQSFVGSNVNLIAPVKIGARTMIAAGSTITKDVPPDSLAIERSALVIKKGWAKKR